MKNLNVIFIFVFIFFSLMVAAFNYNIDPYQLFKNKAPYVRINAPKKMPLKLIFPKMKLYKDLKSDTLVLGSSNCIMFEDRVLPKYFNSIFFRLISYNDYYNMLESYLKLHPETKKVFIVISYENTIAGTNQPLPPKIESSYINIKDLFYALLSFDVTKKSIENFINKINAKPLKNTQAYTENTFVTSSETNQVPLLTNLENLDKLQKENYQNLNKIIKLLEDKKVKYDIVIPPYNYLYLALLYKNEMHWEKINDLRKFLVNTVNPECTIYDFAIYNKYNEKPIIEGTQYFYNYDHPSLLYGAEVFKVLFDKNNEDKSLYHILNKDNIKTISEYENNMLEKYVEENREKVDYMFELHYNNKADNIKTVNFHIKDLSMEDIKKLQYILDKNF